MKKLILLLLLCLPLAVATVVVKAEETYTPLQPAQTGLWFDPEAVGQGLQLVITDTPPFPRQVVVLLYVGQVLPEVTRADSGEMPAWATATGVPSRFGTRLTLLQTDAIFGLVQDSQRLEPVGEVRLIPLACDRIGAEVTVGTVTQNFSLQPLTQLGACYTCVASDFGPFPPGCGY